jgi:tRNA pseudouridine38-40 synthase
MLAPYVWACPFALDLARLQEAAIAIVGTRDFTSFSASDPDLATRTLLIEEARIGNSALEFSDLVSKNSASPATRTIYQSAWHEEDGLFIYRVTGSGFLHHMVRNLVGTFVEAGCGRISADSVPAILHARNRSTAGPTAPARGLFLAEVEY